MSARLDSPMRFEPRYVTNLSMRRPHVVLLGAGASRAALPNGDRRGRKLPLMMDLVEVVGLRPVLDSAGIDSGGGDFEALYSMLVADGTKRNLVAEIEQRTFDYFSTLELPDEPTLYDYLVLSLREKDVIATFNWDPFVVQAITRNQHIGRMPRTLFLHGNVAIGYCMDHVPIVQSDRGQVCARCNRPLKSTPLLFPVTQKDYQKDPFVAKTWKLMQDELQSGYLLTMFGYGAPSTDVEAVNLLKNAWKAAQSPQFKTLEIIDIRDTNELTNTWREFFPSSYYNFHTSFEGSLLARYPRRSCESEFWIEMNGAEYAMQIGNVSVPRTTDWDELYAWFAPLAEAERAATA